MADFYKSPETKAQKVAGWRAARARALAGEGFIYLAEVVGADVVKIGFSINPQKRALACFDRSFDGGRPRLVRAIPGTWADEKELHRTLCRDRAREALGSECYRRSILSHPAIPAELRSAA